jgi:cytochrome oxidase Cu insertion factor (SCO1/SenC/PrrC family)
MRNPHLLVVIAGFALACSKNQAPPSPAPAGAATLRVGDPVPSVEVPSSDGKKVSLTQFRGKKVVLWFYPKADTPG